MPLERGALLWRERPELTWRKLAEAQRSETRAGQREHRMAEGFEHAADLPVASLVDGHVDDRLVAAHGDDAHLCTGCAEIVEPHPGGEAADVAGGEPPGDCRAIGLLDAEARMEQAVRQIAPSLVSSSTPVVS